LKFLFITLFILTITTSASPRAETLTYCSYANAVNFNPFRKIRDVYELTYLMLMTRSYISKDKSEFGILEKFTFLNNGKLLKAKVSSRAKWQDNTPISSLEAALGIALGFKFRKIGKKINVAGIEKFNFEKNNFSEIKGIKIINNNEFELTFESKIEHLTDSIKEAISTNSRHNRVWPSRIIQGKLIGPDRFDLIGKYSISKKLNNYLISALGSRVILQNKKQCNNSTFYPVALPVTSKTDNYSISAGSSPQTTIAFLNSKKRKILNDTNFRNSISSFLRSAFQNPSKGHILKNEFGFQYRIDWSNSENIKKLPFKGLSIATGNFPKGHQIFREINQYAKEKNVIIKWQNISTDKNILNADILILSARVENGRQKWIRDGLSHEIVRSYLSKFTKTYSELEKISRNRTISLSQESKLLKNFEQSSLDERSIIPLTRIFPKFYSRTFTKITLEVTPFGELKIARRKK
jgi:hypothetical protein